MRLKLLTSADKIPTTTRNKRNSARYLIIETTFWNYSCWYGHLYRSECNLKTTCTSEFFKDDRYCTSLKYECDLKTLKNSRVYVFPNCTLETVLLLIIIIISGEMADCDWLRSAFSGPLFSRNVMDPATHAF
jgi:hypothetical protein